MAPECCLRILRWGRCQVQFLVLCLRYHRACHQGLCRSPGLYLDQCLEHRREYYRDLYQSLGLCPDLYHFLGLYLEHHLEHHRVLCQLLDSYRDLCLEHR